MAHYEVSVDFNIIDIAFSQGGSLVAVLGVDGFEIFSWIAREKRSQRLHRVDTFNGLDMAGSLIVRQICFVGEMSVAILASDRISSRVIIFEFGQDEPIVRRTSSQILVGGSYRLFAGDDSDHNLLVQRDDCVLLEGLWNGDEMTFQEIARLPALKPWVEAIKREGEVSRWLVHACRFDSLTPFTRQLSLASGPMVISMRMRGCSQKTVHHFSSLQRTSFLRRHNICSNLYILPVLTVSHSMCAN